LNKKGNLVLVIVVIMFIVIGLVWLSRSIMASESQTNEFEQQIIDLNIKNIQLQNQNTNLTNALMRSESAYNNLDAKDLNLQAQLNTCNNQTQQLFRDYYVYTSQKEQETKKIRDEMQIYRAYLYNSSVFQRILLEEAVAHNYVPNEYDCTEFSKAVIARLRLEGWAAELVHTKVNCSSGYFNEEVCEQFGGWHDFVRVNAVYIEATSGRVILPSTYPAYNINKWEAAQ